MITNQDSERERISYEIEGLHISEATDYILDLNKQARNAALQEALSNGPCDWLYPTAKQKTQNEQNEAWRKAIKKLMEE